MDSRTYIYYATIDARKEPIDRVTAPSLDDAVTYFAERKQINKETFTKLYTVEKYETK